MPLTLTEGDFAYIFDSSQWVAGKYDTTPYYRRHFQNFVVVSDKCDKCNKGAEGAKAVDIVAYKKDSRELWLIETKDLRSIHIVLHLEQPTFHSPLFPQVVDPKTARDLLRKKLRAVDPHAIVGSAQTINENKRVDWRIVFSASS